MLAHPYFELGDHDGRCSDPIVCRIADGRIADGMKNRLANAKRAAGMPSPWIAVPTVYCIAIDGGE